MCVHHAMSAHVKEPNPHTPPARTLHTLDLRRLTLYLVQSSVNHTHTNTHVAFNPLQRADRRH